MAGPPAPAEAQTLASSQAGDAGAAAFSSAVYNYVPVRECLGGRATQAENAADGKPLIPQPPPPPPTGRIFVWSIIGLLSFWTPSAGAISELSYLS